MTFSSSASHHGSIKHTCHTDKSTFQKRNNVLNQRHDSSAAHPKDPRLQRKIFQLNISFQLSNENDYFNRHLAVIKNSVKILFLLVCCRIQNEIVEFTFIFPKKSCIFVFEFRNSSSLRGCVMIQQPWFTVFLLQLHNCVRKYVFLIRF